MAAEPGRGVHREDSQDATQPTARRLKLVMPSAAPSSQDSSEHYMQDSSFVTVVKNSSRSPVRPSYSPVTPTLSQDNLLLAQSRQESSVAEERFIHEPEALPVSLEDNSDAIALRAAISILQMQRQQSLKDIRDLDKLKKVALEHTEDFVRDLNDGKLDPLKREGVEVDDEDDEAEEGSRMDADGSRFAKFPPTQNVIRAPPIEWAKYHVVGEPLDQMHEAQRRYPGSSEASERMQGHQPHSIAAPYRPFDDRVEQKDRY